MEKDSYKPFSILSFLKVLLLTAAALTLASRAESENIFDQKRNAEYRVLRLERIVIEGNKNIPARKIRESMFLKPGDVVNVEMLEREKLHLLSSHRLIQSIDMYTLPGSKRGWVVLRLDVKEKKRVIFETGYGYHDTYGWFLTLIGMRLEHPFGTNSYLRTGLRLGFHVAGIEAEWKHYAPVEGGLGYGLRGFIYGEDHIFFGSQNSIDAQGEGPYTWNGSEWRSFKQKVSRSGIEAALRYEAKATSFSFGFKAEKIVPDSLFTDIDMDVEKGIEDFPGEMKPDIEKTILASFFFRVIHDTRNDFIYPVKGSYFFLWLKNSSSLLGSDRIFTRMKLDYVRYFDLGDYRVLSGRLYAGSASRGAPYYERFYIGGIYSIRGFKELSLSPTTGDDAFCVASGELRFPLIGSLEGPPRLSGLVFVDAGQGWRWDERDSSEEIQSSAGYGVRLMLPWLGTLGIDVGIPFTEGRTGDRFYIHGALGFSF